MATELGKAYVQIIPSAKGISGSISNIVGPEADSAGKKSGSSFGGNLVSVASKVIATAGIGKAIASSVSAGADLQQSLGGVETLFKDSADTVVKNAQNAYKTAGVSANTYMEGVTSFAASLLSSTGGDTKKAADIADTAFRDMSDNANKFGTNMQDIQNAYQGFAKQNYTMLDNLKLGYGGTQKEMQRLLADATKLTGVKYDISNLSDVYSAIHAIQENLGVTGTTAKEAAETFSGSFAAMKASAENLLGKLALGQDISAELSALATTTSTFLFNNFIPMVLNILKALPGAFVQLVTTAGPIIAKQGIALIKSLGSGMSGGIPVIMNNVSQMLSKGLFNFFGIVEQVFKIGSDFVKSFVNGLRANLPALKDGILLIVQDMLFVFFEHLPDLLEGGSKLILSIGQGIVEAVPVILRNAKELVLAIVAELADSAPALLRMGVQYTAQLRQGIAEGVPQVLGQFLGFIEKLAAMFAENLPKLVGKFLDFIKQLISTLADNIPQILEKGREIIVNIANGIAEKVPVVINTIANLISNLIGEISKRLPDILAKGAELIANLVTGLLKALPSIISAVGNIIGKLLGAIASNLPKLVAKGLELIGALAKGLIQAIPILVSHIPTIVNAIVKALGTLGAEMLKIGKDVVVGLWNGIGNQIDWVVGKIRGMGTRILNAVKGIFGIHSPSKEFAWIGKMNMIGLGNGLTGNLGIVSSAMDDIQGELNRNFESTADINYKNIKNASGNLNPFNQATSVSKNKAMPLNLNVVINGRAYKAFVDDITKMQDGAVDLKLAY